MHGCNNCIDTYSKGMQIERQVFISQDANGLDSLIMFTGSCNHNVSPTDGGWWRILKIIGCILIIALLALVFLWVSRNGKPLFVPHVISVYMCKKKEKSTCACLP